MVTLIKTVLMAGLFGLITGCAYDPAYSYNPSGSYYGGSGYGSPNYGYSGYNNGYHQAGYYNTRPNYGYYGGYHNGRYCPDDDDD